jgi:hypothetical protein
MLGTAFPASRLLLVEQPGGWGRAGLADSQFDPAVARQLINTLGALGIRVLAVRRPGRSAAPERRRWIFADCRTGRQAITWGSFEADAELLRLDPDALPASTGDARPVYAVCAHGTHDMCCAIEGRIAAGGLERECPGRVWECSHVGGDRFAANVLVLPTGQQYGRITDVVALAEASEGGRVLPDLLRGQIGLAPPAQAAVVHAQRELGLTTAGAVRPVQVSTAEDGSSTVLLETDDTTLRVGVQRITGAAAKLTCNALGPRTPISYRPLWLEKD